MLTWDNKIAKRADNNFGELVKNNILSDDACLKVFKGLVAADVKCSGLR